MLLSEAETKRQSRRIALHSAIKQRPGVLEQRRENKAMQVLSNYSCNIQ